MRPPVDPTSSSTSEKREKRRLKRLRQRYHEFQLISGGELGKEIEKEALQTLCEDPAMAKRMRETKVSKHSPRLVFRLDKLGGRKICHRDIADLLHNQLHGLNRKPIWCNFGAKSAIVQNVFLRVNCADKHIVLDGGKSETHKFFDREWIILDAKLHDRASFWDALCSVPMSPILELQEHFVSNPEVRKQVEMGFGRGDALKLKLVNSIDQNISFHYPFPNYADMDGIPILPSKEKYKKLSESSPLYALDCEMCVTEGGQSELTRISLIDEAGKVVLDTLVKPSRTITDYVTKFSGITHAMMKDVTVTLSDVQKALANLLPPDAILVGHSLEFDLRSLHLSHPFCIDVALIYNLTGNEHRRTSLRNLCYTFLGENVQGTHGHCSVEDAWNAMRLLKLKLEKAASFGNINLGWNYGVWMDENRLSQEVQTKSEKNGGPASKKAKQDVAVEATVTAVKKPKCSSCSHALGVDCIVKGCSCMKEGAQKVAHCVKCSANMKPAEVELDGETYDYNDLLRIEHTSSLRPLSSLLDRHKKNVMLAPSPPIESATGESCINYTVFDAATEDCQEYVQKVKPLLMDHALCLLEMTLSEKTTPKDVDRAIMDIASKIPKHTLFSVIFVAPKRSVGYFKVK